MSSSQADRDLVILVADNDAELAIRSMLSRHQALGTRPIKWDTYRHPERDPGCRLQGVEFLRTFTRTHAHAILLFDREGCGSTASREEIEGKLERALEKSGWGGRSAAVVLDPELEIWVWSRSPEVDVVLGWADREPKLWDWLGENGLRGQDEEKPRRPKEAMQGALREVRKPRSPSLYQQLAQRVSLTRCTDPAFKKLREVLQTWFPAGPADSPA